MSDPVFLGIDVARDDLEVAVYPTGAAWRVIRGESNLLKLGPQRGGLHGDDLFGRGGRLDPGRGWRIGRDDLLDRNGLLGRRCRGNGFLFDLRFTARGQNGHAGGAHGPGKQSTPCHGW